VVLSTETCSTWMLMMSLACGSEKTSSKTPCLAHRFIRV
jgi:hypothetical protein